MKVVSALEGLQGNCDFPAVSGERNCSTYKQHLLNFESPETFLHVLDWI